MHTANDFVVYEETRKPGTPIPPPPADFVAGPCRCNVCGKRLVLEVDGMCKACVERKRPGYGR
jgi:hypothetical protein